MKNSKIFQILKLKTSLFIVWANFRNETEGKVRKCVVGHA